MFFWDPCRSSSRRGSCQLWVFRVTRSEGLQSFIIRTHMVATGRLCLSKPSNPTFCNCVIVLWITFFLHRKVVRVSVYSMWRFECFFWDHWRSRSRRGSCQVWFLSVTRPERLQNCIIRSHMVATSRLCLSELLCPTFSTCGIVIFDHVLNASAVCTCVSFFYDVLNDFFWDPRRSRSHRGSCQILLFRTKRAESIKTSSWGHIWLPLADFVCLNHYVRHFVILVHLILWCFECFFRDPRASRSRRVVSCQLWCFRSTRVESLQNFIISKHMVATGTLCLSKPKCPTFSNLGFMFWSMCFFHRRVVLVSVYSMLFWMFFLGPSEVTFPSWVLSSVVFQNHTSWEPPKLHHKDIWLPLADFVRQNHYVRQFLILELCFETCAFFIGGLYLCQFILWCFACFFWDPRRSRSRRGSCQVWFFGTTRAESLQNFIIRTHMVATGRLCLSKPLCPTISNCRIVFWSNCFFHRRVVLVSVYSMMFCMFFLGPSEVTFPSWVLSSVVFRNHTSWEPPKLYHKDTYGCHWQTLSVKTTVSDNF